MARDVKEKLIRLCLASILNSDMSSSEIRKAARLFSDGEISDELGNHLENFAANTSVGRKKSAQVDNSELFYEEIRDHINRERLSKEEIVNLAYNSLGIDIPSSVRKNASVKEIISIIQSNVSRRDFEEFVHRLLTTRKRDPYLSGLEGRDK